MSKILVRKKELLERKIGGKKEMVEKYPKRQKYHGENWNFHGFRGFLVNRLSFPAKLLLCWKLTPWNILHSSGKAKGFVQRD